MSNASLAATDYVETDEEVKQRRRVVIGAFLGTTIEYYDFTLYGLLGPIFFGKLFFPQSNPSAQLLAVLAIYSVGFLGRPLGGIVFSHFGDRIGRKPIMIISMTTMGLTSTLIGLMPTYDMIGIWAPVILLVLRVVQGFALGGESAGANVLSTEVGKEGRRGFFSALTTVGIFAAWVCALIASQLVSLLPQDTAMSWGWRIPFLASFLLVALGIWMRLKVAESAVYLRAVAKVPPARVPFFELMQKAKAPLIIVILAGMAESSNGFFYIVFGYSYALNTLHIPASTLLTALLIGNLIAVVLTPMVGSVSDRIGRRVCLCVTYVVSVVYGAFFFFPLLKSGDTLSIYAAMIIPEFLAATSIGVVASFYSEQFRDARLRFSGVGFGRGLGTTLGGGLMPLIAGSLMVAMGGSLVGPIVWFSLVLLAASVAIFLARETKDDQLA